MSSVDKILSYLLRLVLVLVLGAVVCLLFFIPSTTAEVLLLDPGDVQPSNDTHSLLVSEDSVMYFPLIFKKYPFQSPFGVEMSITESGGLSEAVEAKVRWAHGPVLPWADVEPNLGDRNWGALADLEQQLVNARENNIIPIVTVMKVPSWADAGGKSCGPIELDDFNAFANFMYDVVLRYCRAPYYVQHWEFWNRPDLDQVWIGPGSWIGCWGDESDEYYGGGHYGDMLKVVYPKIKEADPSAVVLFGGVLLDCDPTNPPPGPPPNDCNSAKFLEGALRNGGGDYFDVMAFYGISTYTGNLENWEIVGFPTWAPRGGVVAGKADFLREVMTTYSVDKPFFQVGGSLFCRDCIDPPSSDFLEGQAAYVPRLYIRNWSLGFVGTSWFTLNDDVGWGRFEGLLDSNNQPRLGYDAYRFMANLLDGFEYSGEIPIGDPLVGHKFVNGSTTIDIYWSLDGAIGTVTLPSSGTVTIYDKLGNIITASGTIDVDFHPIYVVQTP